MANNVAITAGSGTTVGTDDCGGVHISLVKLVNSTEDSTTRTGIAADPLQVSLANTGANATPIAVASHAVTNAGTFAVQVSSALPAGTNAIGKLSANSGVDIGDVDVTSCALPTGASTEATLSTLNGKVTACNTGAIAGTVTANAGTGTFEVGGVAAHDAAVSGNPVLAGAEARSSLGTAVATGDAVRIMADRYGRQYVAKVPLSWASSNTTPVTTATTTQVIAAPSAGSHLQIHRIHAENSSATTVVVSWNATSGAELFHAPLPQNGTVSINLDGTLDLPTATAFNLVTSANGSVHWTVGYLTVAD